ncbi:MAG: universal stress protein [Gemmataceae bacterium]|nr:universal stress protein [Gemmataceae bacterium]
MKRENDKQLTRARPRQLAEFAPRASYAAGIAGRLPRRVILHPTDHSETSRQAFELACRIARDCGGRLVVLHVAEPVRISSLGMAPVPPLPKGYRGAWESRLRLLRPRDPTVPVEHRLEEGDVAAAILRVAREVPCDLIVMSGRERTWLGRLLVGSVAGVVRRDARCPVVTVQLPAREDWELPEFADEESIIGTESVSLLEAHSCEANGRKVRRGRTHRMSGAALRLPRRSNASGTKSATS